MRKINRPVCPNPIALLTDYKNSENKRALINASHGKCIYCESRVVHISFGDVEHIKPKSKYPALKFVWTNLGYVCTKCNNAKKDKYDDSTPYINPYDEDPKEHLVAVGALLKHKAGSERGELTTIDIDLNRSDLVEKRLEKIKYIERAIDACMRTSNIKLKELGLKDLLKECGPDKEYSIFIEGLLKIHTLL